MAKSEKTWSAGPLRIRVTTDVPESAPRERLTRERIVDVALAQMKERGYEAVSMRSIAKELGTGQASLYAHVANREELDQLVVDRIAALMPHPEPDPERWDEQVVDFLHDALAIYREHPGSARAAMGMIPTMPGALRNAEDLMGICLAGGVPEQYASWACDMFALYVGAVAVEEDIWADRLRTGPEGRSYSEEAVVAAVREHFAALPPEQYPILSSLAEVMTTGTGEERFDFGVRLLVAGLKAVSQRS
ncbi:TetR/AcrR family transcriptional regulator [Nocardioides sp. KR10-350]|uniref:TetR/AcrR family transcriptional regulator n=1 Tax=Nocardioides cheoyonin TaxID=3156615 RepID=UPI0032B4D768